MAGHLSPQHSSCWKARRGKSVTHHWHTHPWCPGFGTSTLGDCRRPRCRRARARCASWRWQAPATRATCPSTASCSSRTRRRRALNQGTACTGRRGTKCVGSTPTTLPLAAARACVRRPRTVHPSRAETLRHRTARCSCEASAQQQTNKQTNRKTGNFPFGNTQIAARCLKPTQLNSYYSTTSTS